MTKFSFEYDNNEKNGEIVLEALLSSDIDSFIDLNLGWNKSWFK